MQIHQFDESQELANMLKKSEILSMTDHAGIRCYAVTRNGQDSLIFSGNDNSGFEVFPCKAFDDAWGGSVHDLARNDKPVRS